VGEDQKQHLELTRDVAQKFNNDFGEEFFPIVEPLIMDSAARIMSLRDGKKKMSKSDESDYSRINLTDDATAIELKIRKARTDPDPVPDGSPDGGTRETRPEAFNLMEIFGALTDRSIADVQRDYGGQQFSAFKRALTEIAVENLGPMGLEMQRLMADPGHVDSVLADGAERAREIAEPILDDVHRIVGFLRS
jgi:tryptophanyl-tRNA synthetase